MIERIEINLLPAEYRVHKKSLHLRREIFYPIMGVAVVWFLLLLWNLKLDSDISQVRNDVKVTDQSIKANKPIKDQIDRLKESKNVIRGKILALEQINVDKAKWVRLMEVICQKLPDFTWLLSCEEKESTLFIDGMTYSFPEVANFMSRLSESAVIKSVDLASIEEKEVSKTFSFSISCKLNSKPEIEYTLSDQSAAARVKKGEIK
jgi:Tfp pilus assembly protein PilN